MSLSKNLSLNPVIGVLKYHKLTFLLYGCMLVSGILLVAAVPKLELHTWINSQHTAFADTGFKVLTLLGDGWFATILAAIFLLIRFRFALMIAFSSLVSGFLVQFIKRVLCREMDRPVTFLEQMPDLELVTGVGLHHHFSFPSGHTTTAFAVLILAGLITEKRWAAFALMLIACISGFSRVYLSQHFLSDVLAGSFIGLLSALFFYWYFQGLNKQWLDKSLIRFR